VMLPASTSFCRCGCMVDSFQIGAVGRLCPDHLRDTNTALWLSYDSMVPARVVDSLASALRVRRKIHKRRRCRQQ
jgi:hypothetical protein